MASRLIIWGAVFAVAGAFFWGKSSYDTTGATTITGALVGGLVGFLVGAAIHAFQKRKGRP